MLQSSRQHGIGKGQKYQWNRMESSKINLHKYRQLIFDKGSSLVS